MSVTTFYDAGELLEVLGEKTFPNIEGIFYKIKSVKWNIVLDGWTNANSFEDIIKG